MTGWFRNRRPGGHPKGNRAGSRYMRATAVVLNPAGEVLLVKHNRENQWALPGGKISGAEDPSQRAIVEVAEETGLHITAPQHVGRYAGNVATHEIFLAQVAGGEPRPNPTEVQDAIWWDGQRQLRTQTHVDAILALARNAAMQSPPQNRQLRE